MSSWLRRESAVGASGSAAMSPGAGSGRGSGGGGGSRNGRSGVKRVRFSMGEAGSDGGGVLDPGRTGDATESHDRILTWFNPLQSPLLLTTRAHHLTGPSMCLLLVLTSK